MSSSSACDEFYEAYFILWGGNFRRIVFGQILVQPVGLVRVYFKFEVCPSESNDPITAINDSSEAWQAAGSGRAARVLVSTSSIALSISVHFC